MNVDEGSAAARGPRFGPEDAFFQVRRRYRSREPRMRQAQAALQAVTGVVLDVKRQRGELEQGERGEVSVSPTEYFAALMNPLQQLAAEKQPDESMLGATVYLVSVVFGSVPAPVLRRQAELLAEIFSALLSRHTADPLVCRHVLSCASVLLRQVLPGQWALRGVQRLMQALLVFAVDPRPHVRKVSKRGAADALASQRPMGRAVAEALQGFVKRELATCTPRDIQVALHVCGLLQSILPVLPPSVAAATLEPVLQLTAVAANPLLTVQAMRTVHCLAGADLAMAEHWEGLSEEERRRHDDLVATVADHMPRLQPNVADAAATTAYLAAGSTVVRRLRRHRDPLQLVTRLPRFCEQSTAALLSDKPEAVEAATAALQQVLEACVTPQMVEQALASRGAAAAAGAAASRAPPTALESVLVTVAGLLGYRYKAVWNNVFGVIRSLFRSMDARAFPLVVGVLEGLDALRGSEDPGNNWDYHRQLDEAVGAAIRSVGPHMVLKALPLNLPSLKSLGGGSVSDAVTRSRSWLLPLLKAHTERCYINFFGQSLVPLADRLTAEGDEAEAMSRPVVAKTLRDMADQVWAAFPAFCRYPQDLTLALKGMAPRLGKMLADRGSAYAHQHICHGLEALVRFRQRAAAQAAKKAGEDDEGKEDEDGDDDEEDEEEEDDDAEKPVDQGLGAGAVFTDEEAAGAAKELEAVAPYARNFLPLLFNILSETAVDRSGVVLNAIKAWASVGEPAAINDLLKACLKEVLQTEKAVTAAGGVAQCDPADARRLRTYVDSTVHLAPHLTAKSARLLHRALRPFLEWDDAALQKKAYKAVGALCHHNGEFFAASWEQVIDDLLKAMGALQPAAARNRLLCLREVVVRVPDLLQNPKVLQVLPLLLGEVVLSVKDHSSKVHDAAYHVLLSLADRMLAMPAPGAGSASGLSDLSTASEQPYITELLMMISAGLTRQPEMQAASLKSLACLVHSYRDELPLAVVQGLLEQTLLLLQATRAREVVSAVLSFAKVCCVYMDRDALRPLLPALVAGLTAWNEAAGTRFRSRIKKILHILLKTVGVRPLRELVPSSHKQLVEYLHKMNEREERKKAKRREEWFEKRRARGEMGDDEAAAAADADMAAAGKRRAGRSLRASVADFHRVAGRDGDKDDAADDSDESDDGSDSDAPQRRRGAGGAGAEQQQLYLASEEVDFMDKGVLRNVVTHDPRAAARRARREAKAKAAIETDADGKMVIRDPEAEDDEDSEAEVERELAQQDVEEQAMLGIKQKKRRGGKRGRDDEADEEPAKGRKGRGGKKDREAGAAAGGKGRSGGKGARGLRDPRAGKRQKKSNTSFVQFGADILNKRTKHKTSRQMDSVINAARKGGASGAHSATKARARRARQYT